MAEQPAHNGLEVGSIPTRPTVRSGSVSLVDNSVAD